MSGKNHHGLMESLILDDNLSATLGGVKLKYSREDGLVEIKKQEESDGRNRI